MNAFEILSSKLESWSTALVAHVPEFAVGILVLVLTFVVVRIADKLLTRTLRTSRTRESLIELLRNLANIVLWAGGALVAAMVVFPGLTPGNIVAVLGLSTIAIGFAFKDIFENFLAGVLILLREPFKLGDFIECEDYEGKVEEISIRDTHIRQPDGQLVVMPNAVLFTNPVTVRTSLPLRRLSLTCGVAYDEDADESQQVIRQAVEALDTRDKSRDVDVFASEFGASSIDFEVRWWTGSTPRDIKASKDEGVRAIKRALDDAGIEIPFPYRTLTFKEPLTTILDRKKKQDEERSGSEPDDKG